MVEATRVGSAKLREALVAVGSLRSDETVMVRPEIAGRISEILFKEGERVSRGQVLVRLDNTVQKADLEKARANLALSKTKYERSIELRDKGFLSNDAAQDADNSLRVAQAERQRMEARLAKTTIRAPFSGTIGLRAVSVGDYVKEGQDMVNLESLDRLKADFRVPEIALPMLRNHQRLQLTFDALPKLAYEARIVAINPVVEGDERAIVFRVQVANKDGRLRAGMLARASLFTSGSKDALVVPEEAVFPVGSDPYVYKVVDGKATRQKIEIGQRGDGRVEVLGGLSADDVVVTGGVMKLREGAPVKAELAKSGADPG